MTNLSNKLEIAIFSTDEEFEDLRSYVEEIVDAYAEQGTFDIASTTLSAEQHELSKEWFARNPGKDAGPRTHHRIVISQNRDDPIHLQLTHIADGVTAHLASTYSDRDDGYTDKVVWSHRMFSE
ncbi:hypothetical protein [Nocardia barduliensis]|uniref:hypothetical protein n=1 Tax=Nocardia barduliensis TaxID=2736643 RepID=UPI001571DB5A|nr:hypothetical protein [Nocardia barduliensis]